LVERIGVFSVPSGAVMHVQVTFAALGDTKAKRCNAVVTATPDPKYGPPVPLVAM
jgi:hypothetical protein